MPVRIMMRVFGCRSLTALVFLITTSFTAWAGAAATTPPRVTLPGHTVSMTAVVGSPAAPPAALTMTVTLQRDDEPGFRAYLASLYDPTSPNFHHFLSQEDIAQRFGPSQAAYDSVAKYLSDNGMETLQTSANRLTLTVSGARTDAERAFGVHVGSYRAGIRDFFANDVDPALPADVAGHVLSISGLSNLAQPHTMVIKGPLPLYQCPPDKDPSYCALYGPLCDIYAATRSTGEYFMEIGNSLEALTVRDYVKSYNGYNDNGQKYFEICLDNKFGNRPVLRSTAPTAGVPWSSINGGGQTIGLVEFANYNPTDVSDFLSMIGAPSAEIGNLSTTTIGGGANSGAGEDEVLLDIDTVMALAPAAKVIVYDSSFPASGGSSFQAVFNRMLSDGLVTVISNSWAYCEDQTSLADVQGIDSILQSAAVAGVSVFSGSGDTGSTCLDGTANAIAVPADSPHLTAVGGTSLTSGAGGVYKGETWWNGSTDTPPSGQGGFGVSRFFSRPSYQIGFTTATARSIPDVAATADPKNGLSICQADAGGCPNGLSYGGTSMAAPVWAAFAALLNQSHGSNLGFFNPMLYPLASSGVFHTPASMGSDFAHVGLGSPNLNTMSLQLNLQSAGTPDTNASSALPLAPPVGQYTDPTGVAADGATKAFVLVTLRDANGNTVPNKSVTLSGNGGSHAVITPASATTSTNDGAILFAVTDTVQENVTFTAVDSTDHVTLAEQPLLPFVGPPPASSGVVASPNAQTADGMSTSSVTVTVLDVNNHPIANKKILLAQSGNSIIVGANPGSTDSNGDAVFLVTDAVQESVTYTATDVTDNNLPLVGSASVTFNNGVGCGAGATPVAGEGYALSVYASGFPTQNNFQYGGITAGYCVGVAGMAFDASGNLMIADYPTGNLYKIPAGGAIASPSNLLSNPGISLGALTYAKDGNLYGVRLATTGNYLTGAVLRIDSSGASTPVAQNLNCPFFLADDPLSGDLFITDGCFNTGNDSADVLRIGNLSGTVTVSVYATTPSPPNGGISFADDGTMYVCADYANQFASRIDAITGTNVTTTSQSLTPIGCDFSMLALGSNPQGGAGVIIAGTPNSGGNPYSLSAFDMTLSPPAFDGTTVVQADIGSQKIVGPDNCVYANTNDAVYRITNADGTCPLNGLAPNPSIVLSTYNQPATAAQATAQQVNIAFPHSTVPLGTPISYSVEGANHLQGVAFAGYNNDGSFTYVGANVGVDKVKAFAMLNGNVVQSNILPVTWTAGAHTTALTLNTTASGNLGDATTVAATLTDRSVNPAAPLSGKSIQFSLTGSTCTATTDGNGTAHCTLALSAMTKCTLTAMFAGDYSDAAASASTLFTVTRYDVIFANGFEATLQDGTCSP